MPRDIATAEINGVDLASEILKNGWAKLKESKREPAPEDQGRKDLETEAKAAGKGLWNPHGPQVSTQKTGDIVAISTGAYQARQVNYTMPEDPQAFLGEWKGKHIDGECQYDANATNLC